MIFIHKIKMMHSEFSIQKELRILAVVFDSYLEPWEIAQFRGAMAHKVGLEHDWFHNHNSSNNPTTFHYRYPLIQYKLNKNHPMLICIDKGVEEAQHFFAQADWTLMIGEKEHQMRLKSLNVNQFSLQILSQKREYRIHNWLALNQDNYKQYQELERLSEKLDFLEPILIGHILSFAKGVQWEVPESIELSITDLLNTQWIKHKRVRRIAFNLHFKCNVFIPNFIGLGKGCSHGLGVIKENKTFAKVKKH